LAQLPSTTIITAGFHQQRRHAADARRHDELV
jgi:hypothetical protein